MLFDSTAEIFFVLLVLIYWRLPFRKQNYVLLAASYVFYVGGNGVSSLKPPPRQTLPDVTRPNLPARTLLQRSQDSRPRNRLALARSSAVFLSRSLATSIRGRFLTGTASEAL